jgi:hypothetical protein
MDFTQLAAGLSPEQIKLYNDFIELSRQYQNIACAIWVTMLVACVIFIMYALFLICKSTTIQTRNFFILTNLLIIIGVIAAEEFFREFYVLTKQAASLEQCFAPKCI